MQPSTPATPQVARDGNRILRFPGWKIAAVSSARAGVHRWSELTLFQTLSGEYLVEKVGRSTVAHTPDCPRVTHRMPSWLDAHEEARVHRTPCVECSPVVGDRMDPHTRLEPQRYTVVSARTLDAITDLLVPDHNRPATLVMRLLYAAREFEAQNANKPSRV